MQAREAGSGAGAMRLLVLHPDDDVAVALADLAPGEEVAVPGGGAVVTHEVVPFGHKLALRPIAQGAVVRKYGQPIGRALADIPAGGWVHLHNLASIKEAGG